jgi:hypothetical protein
MTSILAATPNAIAAPPAQPRTRAVSGRILSAIPVLFLVFDAAIKLAQIAPVTEAMLHLGYPVHLAPVIGLIELSCLALHLMPRTALPGLLLLTAFLGGAVASHLRVGDPLLTHVLFPVYVATMLWGGVFLRDARVRAFFTTTSARPQ